MESSLSLSQISTRNLAGSAYATVASSKQAALAGLSSEIAYTRQACIAILLKQFEVDDVSLGAIHQACGDSSPIVRASARHALATHYIRSGLNSWQQLLRDIILDHDLDDAIRVATYAELLRRLGQSSEFRSFCDGLETATLDDIDWAVVNSIK